MTIVDKFDVLLSGLSATLFFLGVYLLSGGIGSIALGLVCLFTSGAAASQALSYRRRKKR